MLKLLFNTAVYFSVGWLPSQLQQTPFEVMHPSLICEHLTSGARRRVLVRKRTVCVCWNSWGRPMEKASPSSAHQCCCVCQKQMLTWCTAAVSCKLCFYSSICSYQLYSRLNVEMEKISPWYLRKCYGYVQLFLSMIESYWTLRSKSFRLCRDLCHWVSLSMAAAVQFASFSCMPGSCHIKGILASWSHFLTLL